VHERFEIAALSGQLSNRNVTHEPDAKFAQYYNEVTQATNRSYVAQRQKGRKKVRGFYPVNENSLREIYGATPE
jgi:hypothetical protein